MSPEVCSFCGKSFKRLKSHLPHCKAAKSSLGDHSTDASPPSSRLKPDSPKLTEKKTPAVSKKTSPESSGKSGKGSPPKSKKSIRPSIESSHASKGPDSAPQSLATNFNSENKELLVAKSPKPKGTSKKRQTKQKMDIEKPIPQITLKPIPHITLQHVGSTLNQTKTSKPSIRIETTKINTKPEMRPPDTDIVLQPKVSLPLPKYVSYPSTTSKVSLHQSELASVPPVRFPELQSRTGDTAATMEARKHSPSGRSLGQVTLGELPEWLARRTPQRPRDAVDVVQKGWQWYYRKYIDVRKGGVGGVGMLLAGYCVLSYVWSYPHLKRDRWRKYH
ncbi:uncharacterized protein LOC144092716 isoform X2 [Stigmatopora argus]